MGSDGHLQLVGGPAVKRQDDLAERERKAILARNPDRGDPEPTEVEQVLLEDLLIAIRRLRDAGYPCLPSAAGGALDTMDSVVCRCLEIKG